MHVLSLYGKETWFLKMHKKDLNKMSVVYHTPLNVSVVVTSTIANMNVLRLLVYQLSSTFLLEIVFVLLRDFRPQKANFL